MVSLKNDEIISKKYIPPRSQFFHRKRRPKRGHSNYKNAIFDLIGIPIRITVGKKVVDDKVEIKLNKQEIYNALKNDFDKVLTKTIY